MQQTMIRWAAIPLLLSSVVGCQSRTDGGCIDHEWLRRADSDTANWLMYGRTYQEQRFSPLRQIDEHNIDGLGLVWSRELGTRRGLEATPLVVDGIIYTTGSWSVVYAIDAATGDVRWTYDPHLVTHPPLPTRPAPSKFNRLGWILVENGDTPDFVLEYHR